MVVYMSCIIFLINHSSKVGTAVKVVAFIQLSQKLLAGLVCKIKPILVLLMLCSFIQAVMKHITLFTS